MALSDPAAETIRRYDESAEEYASRWLDSSVMARQRELFSTNLVGTRVLDLGCGPGRDAKSFGEMGCEVTGVDLSSELLDIAQSLVPRARFVQMDIRRLGFAAGSFHGAWACASFLHIPHREALATMREIHRVLSPGGFLYLSVKEGEGQGSTEKGTFSAYYHAEELARLAREAGFEVLLLSEVPSHVVFLDLFARKRSNPKG